MLEITRGVNSIQGWRSQNVLFKNLTYLETYSIYTSVQNLRFRVVYVEMMGAEFSKQQSEIVKSWQVANFLSKQETTEIYFGCQSDCFGTK